MIENYIWGFLIAWFSVIGTYAVMRLKIDLRPFPQVVIEKKTPIILKKSFRISNTFNNDSRMQDYMLKQILIQLSEDILKNNLVKVRSIDHYPTNSTQYEVELILIKPPQEYPNEKLSSQGG
jgi:hypothetical protein